MLITFTLFDAHGAILEKSVVKQNRSQAIKKKKFLFFAVDKEISESTNFKIGLKSLQKLSPDWRLYFEGIIRAAAMEWSRYADVNFHILKSDSKEKADFEIMLYTSSDKPHSRRARSSHGSVDFSQKIINLNLPADASRGSHFKVTLHEFGHLLGFMHEHQHPEREFNFDFDFLMSKCGLGPEETCRSSIEYNSMKTFSGDKYEVKDYDTQSIMHYGVHRPLIKENMVIKESMSLSLGDKIAVAHAYPGRREISEIVQNHRELEKVLSSGIIGKCRVSEEGSNDYRYRYEDGSEAHFIEETYENATTNALLDPKCF